MAEISGNKTFGDIPSELENNSTIVNLLETANKTEQVSEETVYFNQKVAKTIKYRSILFFLDQRRF